MDGRFLRKIWRRWVRLGIVLPGLFLINTGCGSFANWRVDNCSTVAKGAWPEPSGIFAREYQKRQTTKAEMDDFVIYNQEWYMNGKELGPYGQYHLDLIIQRLPTVPFPIVVQIGDNPELNKARWEAVVLSLSAAGVPQPENRVMLGRPIAEGLWGEEAPRIYGQMIFDQGYGGRRSGYGYGNQFGGFGNFGGGFGGGGFGGFGGY